jgi:hypothetical protein
MLMIVMISTYIWLIAILYKYRPPLCVLHQAKINSGTGLSARSELVTVFPFLPTLRAVCQRAPRDHAL